VFVERAASTGQVRAREVPSTGKEDNKPPTSVLDFARLTVIFADPLLLAQFYDELKRKFKILRVNNKFNAEAKDQQMTQPHVHINFLYEEHVCEVQLILEDFLLIKDYSHKPYEILRRVQDKHGNDIMSQIPEDKLAQIIEDVIGGGVYCKHPGAASYPIIPT